MANKDVVIVYGLQNTLFNTIVIVFSELKEATVQKAFVLVLKLNLKNLQSVVGDFHLQLAIHVTSKHLITYGVCAWAFQLTVIR